MPAMCEGLWCWACLVPTALDHAAALALAAPQQAVRLSLVGQAWGDIHKRMTAFGRILRRAGRKVEYAFHVEANPERTGNHVHMWTWGDPLAEWAVMDAASRAQMGLEVDVQPCSIPPGEPSRLWYGMKAVVERPAEVTELWPEAEAYLHLNGRRLHHATRNFWRDGPGGARLDGVRPAITVARERAGLRSHLWVPEGSQKATARVGVTTSAAVPFLLQQTPTNTGGAPA
jgi:hypothetical protein